MFDDFEGIETISCSVGDPPEECGMWAISTNRATEDFEVNNIYGTQNIHELMLDNSYDMGYISSVEDSIYGGEEMSFVGIEFFEGKIIGFADSKVTKKYGKKLKAYTQRPYTRKLFWNPHFIIVFHGNSSYVVPDGKQGAKAIYLEDLVMERITKCNTPDELCRQIYRYLKNESKIDYAPFGAIAGYYQDGEMYSFEAIISSSKLEFRCENKVDWSIKSNNIEFYTEYLNDHISDFLTSDVKRLECVLRDAIDSFNDNHPGQYNPVGGNLAIHILNDENKNIPNSETIEAMKETEEMIANKDKGKTYDNFSEIVKEAMET